MLEYMFSHSVLGFCAWDLPALIVLVVIAVVFLVHRHNMKKREEEYQDLLADKLAEQAVSNTDIE